MKIPQRVTPNIIDGSEEISAAYIRDSNIPADKRNGRVQAKFTLTKEIDYSSEKKCDEVIDNLEKLSKDNFGKLKIPNFIIKKLSQKTLQIKCEYIKGRYPTSREMLIVKEYALYRKNDPYNLYTITEYNPNDFIVEFTDPQNIYAIDLDSYRKMNMGKRLEKWQMYNSYTEE
tara:strand:+ start:360 stop:878 length:519 start_codon:yes stop_codon:yes gene_type:complete